MSDSQASLKPQVPAVTSSPTSDIPPEILSNSNALSQGSKDYAAKCLTFYFKTAFNAVVC